MRPALPELLLEGSLEDVFLRKGDPPGLPLVALFLEGGEEPRQKPAFRPVGVVDEDLPFLKESVDLLLMEGP